MAGKTGSDLGLWRGKLYQLGNWMAGKTVLSKHIGEGQLYQLGNWMAGKTYRPSVGP